LGYQSVTDTGTSRGHYGDVVLKLKELVETNLYVSEDIRLRLYVLLDGIEKRRPDRLKEHFFFVFCWIFFKTIQPNKGYYVFELFPRC